MFKYFSFPSDVDLLIDLYSQAQPLLSSAGLSEMGIITVLAAPASHLPGQWSEFFVFSRLPTDKIYTGCSDYAASLAQQLLRCMELSAARQRHDMNFLYNIVARSVAHVYTYS